MQKCSNANAPRVEAIANKFAKSVAKADVHLRHDAEIRPKMRLGGAGTPNEGTGRVPRELDSRIFAYACRIVDLFGLLESRGGAARRVAGQLFDSGTGVAANYAEAGAGQTKADFIAKLAIARKECRESLFWLRLIAVKSLLDPNLVRADIDEATQLTAILTAIIRKAKASPDRGPD